MERNQPRWFLWSRLWSFMAPQLYRALEGRAWTCLRSSNNCGADHNFISILNMLWTHTHRVTDLITFPKRGTFTLHWPHLNKHPHPTRPTHNFHCLSPTSYSDTAGWKHYVFSSFNKMPVHSSRGFHVSPNTERLGQKKSPPERNPICVLIHSAGLDMSKQLAFTAPATPFHFTLADHLNVHTHWIEGSWMAVPSTLLMNRER